MVTPSPWGTSVSISCAIVQPSTPFVISAWATRMIGSIMRTKVKTRRLRNTIRSVSRKM